MAQIGSFALLLALALSAYSFLAGLLALLRPGAGSERLGETARRAGIAAFAVVLLAAVVLVIAAFQNDFSIAYIFHHSNRDLPAPYKFAVLWSGQEGSLLFWSWLLGTYGLVLRLRHKVDRRLFAYASVIIAGVQVFFLLLVNFAAHPFAMMQGQLPADGNGLNPLLQYPEMVIHPPMLYLGYVGFTVPFAFALGALMMRYPGEKWIHITRRWTMVTWMFLTCGIFLGAHWAYSVLGWGGYWGWDPVENASLMPWLTGTAFLHSVMMQEKRGMMKVWNVWLVFCTFLLCMLGTFLTRSGVVSSVHAFAQSNIGPWFVAFMGITLAVCLGAYLKNRDYLASENQLDSVISRESSFLFNNLLFLVACVAVLSGTLFPVFSEWFTGNRISVGAPYFNRVNIPVGLLILFLTGVGPLLAWRKTSRESLKRNFGWPLLTGLLAGGVGFILGFRGFYPLASLILCFFVAATILLEFYRGSKVIRARSGASFAACAIDLTMRNTRRYGGYVIHMGMVFVFIGLAGTAFDRDVQKSMQVGDSMHIGPYTLVLQATDSKPEKNYTAQRMMVEVLRGNKPMMMLFPEKRNFITNKENGTMVAIYSTLKEDLYVVFAGIDPDTQVPVIHAYLNPLVKWIWFGGVTVVFGTLIALSPNRRSVLVLAPAQQPATAEPLPQGVVASPLLREGHD